MGRLLALCLTLVALILTQRLDTPLPHSLPPLGSAWLDASDSVTPTGIAIPTGTATPPNTAPPALAGTDTPTSTPWIENTPTATLMPLYLPEVVRLPDDMAVDYSNDNGLWVGSSEDRGYWFIWVAREATQYTVWESTTPDMAKAHIFYTGNAADLHVDTLDDLRYFQVVASNPWSLAVSKVVAVDGACRLSCRVLNNDSYTFDMACEPGAYVDQLERVNAFEQRGTRTYVSSGHVYLVWVRLSCGCGHYGCRCDLNVDASGGQYDANTMHCYDN